MRAGVGRREREIVKMARHPEQTNANPQCDAPRVASHMVPVE